MDKTRLRQEFGSTQLHGQNVIGHQIVTVPVKSSGQSGFPGAFIPDERHGPAVNRHHTGVQRRQTPVDQ